MHADKPGTYILVLKSHSSNSIQIGRRGALETRPGYYLYVGSAFGPGGVRSRVARHCRKVKSKHWHIDYLREYVTPIAIWYSHAQIHLEHDWATALLRMKTTVPVTGFGCTDCKCKSHLFYTASNPELEVFAHIVRRKVNSSSCLEAG